jgi:hypothetical protein
MSTQGLGLTTAQLDSLSHFVGGAAAFGTAPGNVLLAFSINGK